MLNWTLLVCSTGSYVGAQRDIIGVLNGNLGAQREIIMCSTGHYWCAQWKVRCLMGSYVLNWKLLCAQLDIISVLNGKL